MKETTPEDLNDFPIALTTLLLQRANELWHNAYSDCTPARLTIPDLEELTRDTVVRDTVMCMPGQEGILFQLKEFNRIRAEAIGVTAQTKRSPLPLYDVLFERPEVDKEDEFPF